MRRVVAVLLALLVVAGGSAAYVWYRLRPPRLPPLEGDWRATVRVLAGDGVRGTIDGPGWRARFSEPFGIVAAPDGTIFVADAGDAHAIRRISAAGDVSTLAGGTLGFSDGAGEGAAFSTPSGLARAADGTLYLADTGNHAIRRIAPDGQVSTLAGDGTPGYADGVGSDARFNGPIGVAVAPDGRVVVADSYNDRIRVIGVDGAVTTLAGSGRPGAEDGAGSAASFDTPTGVTIDARGVIYVADTGNHSVRTIDERGLVNTPPWAHGNGLSRPLGVAVGSDGDVYVADEDGRIVAIRADGTHRTLAGARVGFADGDGRGAGFRRPSGVSLIRPGRLVVADAGNALVRLVAARSQVTVDAPTSPVVQPRFDLNAFGWMPLLWPVAPFSGPLELAGNFGEVRGRQRERFHVGIDVRVEQGTLAYAVRDGIVSSPVSNNGVESLDEWLRIGDLTYVHIRAGRTREALLDPARFVAHYEGPSLRRLRVRRGARFVAGDVIGTVNRFNHVHMNVGWPGEEHNPLLFRLSGFEDTVAPTIPQDGIRVYDDSWRPLNAPAKTRLALSGRVRVVIDAYDQADDNFPRRRLAPYALGYQVLRADGLPAAGFEIRRPSLRFDRVEPEPEAPYRVYGAGSGIPFYNGGSTRYRYIVTNRLEDGHTAEGFWDTDLLPSGDYVLRGWAVDISGNSAQRDVPITVGAH